MPNLEPLLTCNVRAELARRNFADFVHYVMPTYDMRWFHSYICEKLQAFVHGEIKKLMIFVPPQHGKSQLSTRLFPAYLGGVNPGLKMVVASYNATLAQRFNRDIQRVIDTSLYSEIFPETQLNNSNVVTVSSNYLRNSEVFEFVGKGGFVKTVGRGGALTGTPVDIGIIDDPLKDRAEAMSSTIRESLWSWYQDVFETRLHNNSQQIVIQTRWHEEDLSGKLLARDNDWEVIVFEAIKENHYDYDPREKGEALWPEKHSLERIEKVRDTSPLTFDSLYQQNPKPTENMGLLWTTQLLTQRRTDNHPELIRTVIAIDPATTSSKTSDETGIAVVGKDNNGNAYLLEDLSGTYTPQQWASVVVAAQKRHSADCYVAETNQGGQMVEAVLRQFDKATRIKTIHAHKGKYLRAEPVYSLYEQGKVYHVGQFPRLESQMVTFNPDAGGDSPDRVDALVYGVTELILGKSRQNFFVI